MEVTTEHLKWVKRYINQVRSPTAPLLDAEDLAQEGWIAMWVAAEKAKRSGREINDAYLKQAARWTILNSLKKRYPDIPLDSSEMPDSPVYQPDVDLSAHGADIRAAVGELPQKQKEYVYLRFWEGWSDNAQLKPAGYSTSLWYNPRSGAKAALKSRLLYLAV